VTEFSDSSLVVRDSTHKVAFNFAAEANMTGKPAGLWIGRSTDDGGGEQGLLFLRNKNGSEGIILDGSNGFSVRDHDGKVVLNFAGEANMTGTPAGLWIGKSKSEGGVAGKPQGGGPGLLFLRNKDGFEGIILDGSNGFSVRDHNGKVVLNFAGEANMTGTPAGLWIGRSQPDGGGPGLLVVRDASGKDSVIIDGSQGDITLSNADCAEDFDVDVDRAGEIEPGCVVVVDDDGRLQLTATAYDKRVVGVASGAGDKRPGLILDRRHPAGGRRPVALLGKVDCLVDADIAPIQVGDVLTSSSTLGHAMKATDPLKAFGSVIGKALRPLGAGQHLIPILITLQ
jgi:hypothetical protein